MRSGERKPPRTKRIDRGLLAVARFAEADLWSMKPGDRDDFGASEMEDAIEWIRATARAELTPNARRTIGGAK